MYCDLFFQLRRIKSCIMVLLFFSRSMWSFVFCTEMQKFKKHLKLMEMQKFKDHPTCVYVSVDDQNWQVYDRRLDSLLQTISPPVLRS